MSFLKEQINPKNKPELNAGFQVQMDILRDADPEKVAVLVLRKKVELDQMSFVEARSLFSDLLTFSAKATRL